MTSFLKDILLIQMPDRLASSKPLNRVAAYRGAGTLGGKVVCFEKGYGCPSSFFCVLGIKGKVHMFCIL